MISRSIGDPYSITDPTDINQFFYDHAYCNGSRYEIAHGGWFELYDEYHED